MIRYSVKVNEAGSPELVQDSTGSLVMFQEAQTELQEAGDLLLASKRETRAAEQKLAEQSGAIDELRNDLEAAIADAKRLAEQQRELLVRARSTEQALADIRRLVMQSAPTDSEKVLTDTADKLIELGRSIRPKPSDELGQAAQARSLRDAPST